MSDLESLMKEVWANFDTASKPDFILTALPRRNQAKRHLVWVTEQERVELGLPAAGLAMVDWWRMRSRVDRRKLKRYRRRARERNPR